ncbi:MAG: hypothetical protein ACE15D_19025 [Candidatus Eisenbacteria bacterium]|nr:hypothetical protein [Candidatus Eisenbacteria bacterium]
MHRIPTPRLNLLLPVLGLPLLGLLLGFLSLCSCGASRAMRDAADRRTIPSEEPILLYDRYSSWFRGDTTRHHLRIWQDGWALAQDRFRGNALDTWGRIAPEEIEDLLAFLIHAQRLPEITEAGVDSARARIAKETGIGTNIADAGWQQIRYRDGGRVGQVSLYAADLFAPKYPEITEYARFASCVRYLEGLRTELILGGSGPMGEVILCANERLVEDAGPAEPVSRSDFREATRWSSIDLRTLSLDRKTPVAPDTIETVWGKVEVEGGRPRIVDFQREKRWRDRTVREMAAERAPRISREE